MPRPLRKEFENAWYHVMNRGAGRRNIYKTDSQKELFLSILKEANKLFGIEIHAYCLMDNHYHLLVRTPRANLSRAMRHINGVYTQRFNRIEKIDGSLFRGRYKAIIVSYDDYLLYASRYIHLNPVSAKMVSQAEKFTWSSYKYYLYPNKKPDWLSINETLSLLNQRKASEAYRHFINSGLDDTTRKFYDKRNSPWIFGDDYFKENLLKSLSKKTVRASLADYKRTVALPDMEKIIKVIIDYFGIAKQDINGLYRGKRNEPREIAIYGCRLWSQETLSSIAARFGGSTHSNISNIVSRMTHRLGVDAKLKKLVDVLYAKLQTSVK